MSPSSAFGLAAFFRLDVLPFIAVAVFALYGVYNIYFHPLRKFPGPKLWAAYRIPYCVGFIRGRLPHQVLEFHRRYGPVVRIAPDELAFADAGAWQDIYGLLPNRRQNPMSIMTFTPYEPGKENSFAGATDAVHAQLRRLYAPAFSGQAVEAFSDVFVKYADLLVSRLESAIRSSPVQDLDEWFQFVSFDIIGDFAFGESFHCLENQKSHFFMKTVIPGITVGSKMNQFERYGIYTALKPLIPKSMLQAQIDLENFVSQRIEQRLQQDGQQKRADLFSFLQESQMSSDALQQNATIIVMAGSLTISISLSSAIFLLCKHPQALRRVQGEARNSFQSDNRITATTSQQLPYVNAVLNESLRMISAGGFGHARWIRGEGGQPVAGYHVPKDTLCTIFHYAAFRYERNFTQPDAFIPERWLPNPPSELAQDDYRVFEPFSVGPRGCIGKAFANVEIRILFIKMLRHFDFALDNPNDTWLDDLKTSPVWIKPPLMVRLKSRAV